MPFVRTVLGDIDSAQLGVCYAHEHVIIDASYTTQMEADFLLDSVEHAAAELKTFHAAGGRAVIDAMPCDSGRNILKLAEASGRSGVHLVAPTGLHLRKYYPDGHWMDRLSADELAELFVADIEEGVDANDYGGPFLSRTTFKAGVIKIAGGLDKLTTCEEKIFRAAAKAHVKTGCPILTHTEQGTAALEQAALLKESGADLSRVVLSHCDRKPDVDYHRAVLRTGVKLEYDSAFRWKAGQENHTLNLVVALIQEFPNQIMLGMDAARKKYWKSYGGGPGLDFLLTDFSAKLRIAGVTESALENIFVKAPAESYSFARS
jgi:5-phospho-D-xylono-1,4-lactonase